MAYTFSFHLLELNENIGDDRKPTRKPSLHS